MNTKQLSFLPACMPNNKAFHFLYLSLFSFFFPLPMDYRMLTFLYMCLLSFCLGENTIHGGAVYRKKKGFDPSRVTQLSWKPRIFLYNGFLSDEECDHLISLAKGKLQKSRVVNNQNGDNVISKVRTSSGMFVYTKDEIVSNIEERIAIWTFLPRENGEHMQILRYEHGEKYEPHVDYLHDKKTLSIGSNRVATVLMYLSNVEKGGETVFPKLVKKVNRLKDETWSDCTKDVYAVKPKKGDALLFFSLHANSTTDQRSVHGSCPVIAGEKWSATKWIHERRFELNPRKGNASRECTDENINCSLWAASGECEKNSPYMIGSQGIHGYCRKSCNAC